MNIMTTHSQSDTELHTQIKTLINSFRRSRHTPPLSLEELAVAIVAVTPDLTLVDLQRHILTAFKYYNVASVESSILRGYQGSIKISHFSTTFATLLRRFDLPFEVSYAKSDDEGDDHDELIVISSAARVFLQKHLPGAKKGAFPFLKLPCELRLQIYGHCLGLPKSGVAIRQAQRHTTKKEVVVRTKDFDTELQMSDWEDLPAPAGVRARWDNFEFRNRHDGTLKCQDLSTHLALLTVNKEIYNEAMPVFYSLNSFVCSDLFHLESFLATLAPERREQLRHISFFYTSTTHSKAAKAFKMLGEIQKLKRLDIVINEADFVAMKRTKGERVFPDVLKLPGFHTLKSMRAVKTVQFHGDCDTIREALQSWVVDNEVNGDKQKKKKVVKKVTPKVAKKVLTKVARVANDDEEEEDSDTDVEDNQDLTRATTPRSALLSSYYSSAASPKPSTPRIGEANRLASPFKFQPSNSGSYLANRFQMASPPLHNALPTTSEENASASDARKRSFFQYEEDQDERQRSHQVNTTTKPPVYFQQGCVPNIATRMLLQGPGQMGDWKPLKPQQQQRGQDMWTQATVPALSPFDEVTVAGMQVSSQIAPSYRQSGMLQMEDLLEDRDDYELMQ